MHWSEELGNEHSLCCARAGVELHARRAERRSTATTGMFNKIHHDIGTHVVHHLFPQIPHYHLTEATEVRWELPHLLGRVCLQRSHSCAQAADCPILIQCSPTHFLNLRSHKYARA